MTLPAILMTTPMHPAVTASLGEHVIIHHLWEQPDADAFFAAHGHTIRGVATSGNYDRIDDSFYSRLPALEIVASFGVGYDNVDAEAAAARRIIVTNTPGVLDDEVADFTIGLLLATIRQMPRAERFIRDGLWPQGPFPLSPTLRERRVGILGLGGIGKAIARRLEGFGIEIGYHGRTRQASVPYPWYPTPSALAAACDTLIAIVPGDATTRHMIDRTVLKALGPNGIFINVSRGSVVDEDALVSALANGTILAAGLDVYANEPLVPAGLLELSNVVLMPHIGSASHHTRAAMAKLVAENLLAWFYKGEALTVVRETRFETS